MGNNEITQGNIDRIMREEIGNRFTYHSPKPEDVPKFERLRNAARKSATRTTSLVPDSWERTEALNHLDEVVMFSNAAISRHS